MPRSTVHFFRTITAASRLIDPILGVHAHSIGSTLSSVELTSTERTMGYTDKARTVAAVYDLIGEGRGQVYTMRGVSLIEAVARGRPVHQSASAEG